MYVCAWMHGTTEAYISLDKGLQIIEPELKSS